MTDEPLAACPGPGSRRKFYAVFSLLLIAPLLIWIYRPVSLTLDVVGYPLGRDFINVWAGPRLAFSGQMETLFDFARYGTAIDRLFGEALPMTNWSYPLWVLPAFWPLSQLPYFWALAVWTFGLGGLFAAVVLSQIEPAQRWRALVILALAPACLINTVGGQTGFLSGALLIGGTLLIDRRPILAGVLFGLLSLKPQLGLVLPFALLALLAWRTIVSAAATVIGLLAGSVAMFGIAPWQQYFDVTAPYLVSSMQHFHGFFKFMMASVLGGARTFGVSYSAAMATQVVVSVLVIAGTCWGVRRAKDPCRRAFVLASAAPLATPYAFNYDLPAVAAVLVWVLFGRLPWRPEWSVLYLLAWVTPVALMYANMLGLGVCSLVLILFFIASLQEAAADPASADSSKPRRPAPAWSRPLEA